MKKLIALVIASMMVLSMVPVMTFGASAANAYNIPDPDKGSFWTTYRDLAHYNLVEGETFKPTAGYKYTSEGFQTIAPDYTDSSPKYTVTTSDPVDLADGFYMQVRIDEFAYGGEDGKADEWISFFISETPALSPPATEYGSYWCSLIRGNGDGKADVVSHLAIADTDSQPGSFPMLGIENGVTVPRDADGKEVYEFAVIPKGDGTYSVEINGIPVKGCADQVSPAITKYEQCYIGIIPYSSAVNGTAKITILKQGNTKEDAEPLTTGPSKDPEFSSTQYAEIADPSTVPVNTPAMLFDTSGTTTYKDPEGTNCSLSKNADGTWKITASADTPYFMWSIRNEISYAAEDFPVFGMMLKNYAGDDGLLYYCAGDLLSPSDDHKLNWSQWDLFDGVDEEGNPTKPTAREYTIGEDKYVYITVDISADEEWTGRIRGVRPDFRISDMEDPAQTEFDLAYMGMFRSADEAFAYGDKYITDLGGSSVEQTQPESQPTEDTDGESGAESISGTEAATAIGTSAGTAAAEEGCASAVGFASVAVLTAAAAAVALRKKH